jgi:hypothetical protein
MSDDIQAQSAIRHVVENWVVYRDSGNWDRFRTVWHEDARMHSTWFRGSAEDFISHAAKSWGKGGVSCHFLGGSAIEIVGNRAIAQTKKRIDSRQTLEGVVCDVVVTGRFYQFFEKRDGRWAIVLHQGIYEKDRADPVDPNAKLTLDPALLAQFPEGYRHLAYGQTKSGFEVMRDLPGLRGASVERLYAAGASFLTGNAAYYE